MRRLPLVLLLLALAPALATRTTRVDAQVVRRGMYSSEPSAFVTLGAALQNGFTVYDGTTGSQWEFGDATQYSASLEKVLAPGATLGVHGNLARVPLTYVQGALRTDADALVSQGFASLSLISGRGFHSILEGDLGATAYSSFTARGSNASLPPTSPDVDFAFGFGYGAGYSFNPRFAVEVVQTQTTTMHQKTGLAAGDGASVRTTATRLSVRLGL